MGGKEACLSPKFADVCKKYVMNSMEVPQTASKRCARCERHPDVLNASVSKTKCGSDEPAKASLLQEGGLCFRE